ncbi:MAG: hypothetical protein ABIR54_17855 [Burkholderiaceae bacterium]
MSTHVKQRYVPKFLLEHRHSGADEKLSALRGAHRKLDSPRFKARSVARLAPPAQFSVGANSLAAWCAAMARVSQSVAAFGSSRKVKIRPTFGSLDTS